LNRIKNSLSGFRADPVDLLQLIHLSFKAGADAPEMVEEESGAFTADSGKGLQ
jgi:hypothetical protein